MSKNSSTLNNIMNVPAVKHETLMAYFDKAYENKLALMIHGTFGIGKSAVMKAYAKHKAKQMKLEYSENPNDVNDPKKFVAIVINLHQFDVSGFWLPVFVDGKYTQEINDQFPIKGQGIIFFDEINLAPNMVQANAYQFILDRRLGKYVVPNGYGVFAAGNTVTDNAHIHEMATPLKNRLMHFLLNPPTAEDWVNNFAIDTGVDARIVHFLLFADHFMHKYDPDITENVFGIPTPRSWEFTSRMIKDIKHMGKDESTGELYEVVAANVGTECARSFVSFVKLSQDIDIAKVFKAGTVTPPKEVDQLYALMSAMLSYLSKKPEMTGTFVKLIKSFKNEHAIILLKQAKTQIPTFIETWRKEDEASFIDASKKFLKLML